ncbi:melanoma cell adhesion molecule b [Salminus brasiliensis]|uniref:melanoma cell adhesion molecule b n=1 Tax=Salminus brasiliensis TaxID=930266 RepID=UPI003B82E068
MAQRGLTLTLTALHLLVWRAWAIMEVSMEDRKEVLMGEGADIICMFGPFESESTLVIEWFVRSPGGNRERIHYKDGSTEAVDEATSFRNRLSVSYSLENSILKISTVQLDDEQEYICRVSVDADVDEKHTRLLVFNAPSRPSIEVETYVSTDTDKLQKIASCKVENAYPTPNITWHKNDIPLQHSGDHVLVRPSMTVNPNRLQTVQSELQLRVEKNDKDATFYCEVSYFVPGAEKMMESDRFNINVNYPTTEITMSMVSPKGLVKEGDTVEISCLGDGNPQPVVIFSLDDDELEADNGLLVLVNVTRKNSGQYICTSLEDVLAEYPGDLSLSVHFLDPIVITPEEPIELKEGQDQSLTCNALSSLPTHSVWYKDNTWLKEGHVLTLSSASYDTAGTYTCRIEASDLPELWEEKSVKVIVRGKPMITEGVQAIPLDRENLVNLSCIAKGHPTPKIAWTLSDEQARLGEWNPETEDYVLSVITVSTTSNFSVSCEVTNELGTVTASHNVEPSKSEKPNTITTSTTSTSTKAPTETLNPPKKNERVRKEGSGVIIAVIIILILLLAILGSVLYFLYKKGKIPCGRSGKQDLTKESASKDDIVVEMKSGKSEEAVLLQGVNGDKKIPNDQ